MAVGSARETGHSVGAVTPAAESACNSNSLNDTPLPSASYFDVPVVDLDSIRDLIRQASAAGKEFAIVGHQRADPDCAGAMEGMARVIELINPGANVTLFSGGEPTPGLASNGFYAEPLEKLVELSRNNPNLFVIQVDAPSTTMMHVAGSILPDSMPTPDLVLDHHSGPSNGVEVFRYLDPDRVGAASTIALALIHRELAGQSLAAANGLTVDNDLAGQKYREIPDTPAWRRTMTFIAAGIQTDNRSALDHLQAQSSIDQAQRSAAARANPEVFEQFELSRAHDFVRAFQRGNDSMEVHEVDGVRIGFTFFDEFSGDRKTRARPHLATAADDYLKLRPTSDVRDGLDIVCVVGVSDEEVIVSIRAQGSYDVQRATCAAFGDKNGGARGPAGGACLSLEQLVAQTPTLQRSDPVTMVHKILPALIDRILAATSA